MAIAKPMSNLTFRFMTLWFKVRDFLRPREEILKEVDIEPGFCVLDYGCGPGGYTIPAAQMVGEVGKVYALDMHPLALRMVQSRAARKKLTNIDIILSDCATGLPDRRVDVVLLYDTFHMLAKPGEVLAELYRILKPGGILSFNDHHMKDENEIIFKITGRGLFQLSKKGKRVYSFHKI